MLGVAEGNGGDDREGKSLHFEGQFAVNEILSVQDGARCGSWSPRKALSKLPLINWVQSWHFF
jgi:hypothetical protein